MKERKTAAILAILVGGIGGHKFYMRQYGLGVLYLLFFWTFIPAIIGVIEGIMLFTQSDEKFQEKVKKVTPIQKQAPVKAVNSQSTSTTVVVDSNEVELLLNNSLQKVQKQQDDGYAYVKDESTNIKRFSGRPVKSNYGWVMNPNVVYKIEISNVSKDVANKLSDLLYQSTFNGFYSNTHLVSAAIAENNITIKQVEEYVDKYKPMYESSIEHLKQNSEEWKTASDMDKNDLLVEFQEQVVDSFDININVDLEVLFYGKPDDITVDDKYISKYGAETFTFYLEALARGEKVIVSGADHWAREQWEDLVKNGLAVRGTEIPVNKIIETMKVADINEMISDVTSKIIRKKADVVAAALEVPDIRDRLSKKISFRELFMAKQPTSESERNELNEVLKSWNYSSEIAKLLLQTFSAGEHNLNIQDIFSYAYGNSKSNEWTVSCHTDCKFGKKASEIVYSDSKRPNTPFHIGCSCSISRQ
jgi:TM2 domain-containing membrane protein YozV